MQPRTFATQLQQTVCMTTVSTSMQLQPRQPTHDHNILGQLQQCCYTYLHDHSDYENAPGQGSCSGRDLWKRCRQTGDIQDIHHMHTYTHAVCTMFARGSLLCLSPLRRLSAQPWL